MNIKKLAIAGDHAGFQLKSKLKEVLINKGVEVVDFGPNSEDSCDYADFAHPLSLAVENKEADLGILICGSGNGVAMTANKYQDVRAGLCWNKEIVHLIRSHNNANILCIPARFTAIQQALEMVEVFLNTQFEGGRHQNRIDKIPLSC